MNSIVTLSGVSFEWPNGCEVINQLSLTLNNGITALVGPNGVGKTTLAKLLTGELEPTSGVLRRSAAVTYFQQREQPKPISVNEFLGDEYNWSLLGEELLASVDRELMCTYLSGGQWMRVRLAKNLNETFLILDEPTNDLDLEGRKTILNFLRNHRGGVLLISHDRECLDLCSEVLEISNKGLAKYGVGWTEYSEIKKHEREKFGRVLEVAKRERAQAFGDRIHHVAAQEKRNRRGAVKAVREGVSKILIGARKRRAQATTGKVETATLEKTTEAVQLAFAALENVKVDPLMFANLLGKNIPNQKLVAEAVGFNVQFRNWVYKEDLNFSWRGNVRIALKGKNGCGKSTLIKALVGEKLTTRDQLHLGELTGLYIDQGCTKLDDNKTILENVQMNTLNSESETRNKLAKFLFTKDLVFQKIGQLSGGERLRVALAKGFLSQEKPELLILDEPTNNLDLQNIEFLESLVRKFRGALLITSHDDSFLKNCNVTETFHFET